MAKKSSNTTKAKTKRLGTQQSVDAAIWSICDIMRRGNVASALQYVPELTWILFLRILDETEEREALEAEAIGQRYTPSLKKPFRWRDWAAPAPKDGPPNWSNKRKELDDAGNKAFLAFVNGELIPYLKGLREKSQASSRQKVISEILSGVERVRIDTEKNFLDVLDKVHEITNEGIDPTHVFALSQVYEGLLLKMGEKGSDAGQFFTPREVIRAMVRAIDPQIGETVYDPCCGTGGFLAQAYEHMRPKVGQKKVSADQVEQLKHTTFWGREKENLIYPIGLANLILHGIDRPNIWHGNALTGDEVYGGLFADAPPQFDVILTNPPFGGKESVSAQTNFDYRTSATQVLFLQHIIRSVKDGGRCGIVIDEGELIQGVKSWQARQYSVKLARDSIRGQLSNIMERKGAPGGQPPYGYDKQHLTPDGKVLRTLRWMADGSKQEFGPDGKLVRVIASDVYLAKAKGDIVRYTPSTPDRVDVIRRIFDLCAKGYGIKYTAEILNNEGIPSMRGSIWNPSNIAMMLRCPVYRGAVVYNKRTSGSIFGMDAVGKLRPKKAREYKLNDEADWIIVEDVHEPLVSKETFEAATRKRAKNRELAGKARSVRRTLASTLFVCKRCGYSFTTVRDKRCGEHYRKYTCAGYHRYGKNICRLYNIPGVPMDAFILRTIRKVIFQDAASNKAIDAFVKTILAPRAKSKKSEDQERELEQLNRRIKTTVGMLADLSFEGIDDLNKVLIDLKAKRDALMAKLATKQPKSDGLPTERELRAWAKEQLQRIEELAQKTEVELPDRQLVEAYVDRIEVDPETKTGVIVMHADLRSLYDSSSTRVVGGDDPQTDESARSISQCQQRESILAGAVLGLAGPGQKISGIMPCTVIRPGDMADRILNRDHHPQWQGQRTRMVYSFPTDTKLWDRYAEIRAEGLRNEDGGAGATAFYRQHQLEMDAGSVIAWPVRFNYDELSAIQHAMNLKYQDEAAFWAEYQNEPLPEVQPDENELTADQIAAKLNGLPKGRVPLGCQHLTMFIDVQQKVLFYVICAWAEEFSGTVLEYGAWPDPQRSYFSLRDVTKTLASETPGTGLEGAIYAGLQALTERQLAREWHREDGASLRIERCLIDANWGTSTDVVYQFCRQSPHAALLLPSHGRFVGASSLPFADYKRRPGDRVGLNWRIPSVMGKRAVRHVSFDTNFWKSFVFARLAVAMADKGSLALFGQKPEPHRLFAEHLTAEYRVRTEGRGRTVDEWKPRLGHPDNHWLDGIVGCAVGAAILGVKLLGDDARRAAPAVRLKLSELRHRRHG